jgi:hypothetical protein
VNLYRFIDAERAYLPVALLCRLKLLNALVGLAHEQLTFKTS